MLQANEQVEQKSLKSDDSLFHKLDLEIGRSNKIVDASQSEHIKLELQAYNINNLDNDNNNNNNNNNNNINNNDELNIPVFSKKTFLMRLSDYIIILLLAITLKIFSHSSYYHKQCVPGYNNGDNDDCSLTKASNLEYALNSSTISGSMNNIIIFISWISVFIFSIIWSYFISNDKKYYHNIHWIKFIRTLDVIIREILFVIYFTHLTVGIIKTTVGRPRPNFFNQVETNPKEARASFPSGHSATAFSMHTLLACHLYHSCKEAFKWVNKSRMQLNEYNVNRFFLCHFFHTIRYHSALTCLINVAPFIASTYVACTRLTDYKHFYSDVIAGALLGMGIAILGFKHYSKEMFAA